MTPAAGAFPPEKLYENQVGAVPENELILESNENLIAESYRIPALMERHSQLADIRRLIADPRIRLLTLTGIAGVGKSRLAATALESTESRTVTVDLADVTDRSAAWDAVSTALDENLGDDPILLLDNCDRFTGELAGDISALLSRCPDLTIVATSRRAFDLYQECLIKVYPLSCEVPPGEDLSPAARLVLNSLDTRNRGVSAAVDRPTLEAIVSTLGGVPMALELAATSIGRIGASRTLDRLISGIPLLPSPFVDTPQRHRTIRDCMAWSLSDLDETAVELLLHISISDVLTDLEEVLLLSGGRKELIADRLSALVNRSLLDQKAADNGHYTYSLSGLTRTFCRQMLYDDPPRRDRIRRARANGLYHLAAEIGRLLDEPGQRPTAMLLVDRWLADMIATIHYLIDGGASGRAVHMLSTLEDVWIDRGRMSEAEEIVNAILRTADSDDSIAAQCRELLGRWALRSARFRDAVALLTLAAEGTPPVDPDFEYRLAHHLGEAHRETRDYARAREQLSCALQSSYAAPVRVRTALELARSMVDLSEPPLREDWSSIRDRATELPHRRDRLTILNALGRTLLRARAPHRALEAFHLVLRTPDPAENLLEMVTALEGCARAYHIAGAEYSEQIQRLSAAAHWIRDTYDLPQLTDHTPGPIEGDAESGVDTDDPIISRIGAVLDVDEAIAYALSTPLLSTADLDSPVSRLTKRQLEIAHLVAEGMTNRMIATRLGIAEWTVVNHLRQVMTKLDCPSRLHVALVIERESQQTA